MIYLRKTNSMAVCALTVTFATGNDRRECSLGVVSHDRRECSLGIVATTTTSSGDGVRSSSVNIDKMGKSKKAKEENPDESQVMEVETEEVSYEEKLNYASVIAQPMAPKKLAGRIYRLIKKASQHRTYLRNGLKVVQNRIRKGERGIVVFAGDISPVEVMAHLPAVCEEKELPYIYTPSKEDLGSAMGVKRGFLIVLIRENDEYKDLYDKVLDEINKVPKVF
ncbi:H/ACA ribonucleoprotein complex subunit 2-like [Panulirus ornatus]|uniref:H/ACA ribonucleoprotein complex subunit 2-like n=1 Tax=Panulirus ornatus TaxID=150431 RepID=UPI003A842081